MSEATWVEADSRRGVDSIQDGRQISVGLSIGPIQAASFPTVAMALAKKNLRFGVGVGKTPLSPPLWIQHSTSAGTFGTHFYSCLG